MPIGVFVGRLCPIHIGHQEIISKMIEDCGIENCLVILGSVAQKRTFRVLFSYSQRKKWIRAIYGDTIRIAGVPDFPGDNDSWFELVNDIIESSFKHDQTLDVVFYGGSVEDIELFAERGYGCQIVDRTKIPVSATVIRDMALRGMDISNFIHPYIKNSFLHNFAKAMEESETWETPF